mmetsp:Transcript_7033/g.23913  ORF Transcript_7033/g.23913 Transcript_7033/m.23913 type:complete len:239 (-) Transcript_7033:875-1591(-)
MVSSVAFASCPPGPSEKATSLFDVSFQARVSFGAASSRAKAMPVAADHLANCAAATSPSAAASSDGGTVSSSMVQPTVSPGFHDAAPSGARSSPWKLFSRSGFVLGPTTPSSTKPAARWIFLTSSDTSAVKPAPGSFPRSFSTSAASSSASPSLTDFSMDARRGPFKTGVGMPGTSAAGFASPPRGNVTSTWSATSLGRRSRARSAAVTSTCSSKGGRVAQFAQPAGLSMKKTSQDPA